MAARSRGPGVYCSLNARWSGAFGLMAALSPRRPRCRPRWLRRRRGARSQAPPSQLRVPRSASGPRRLVASARERSAQLPRMAAGLDSSWRRWRRWRRRASVCLGPHAAGVELTLALSGHLDITREVGCLLALWRWRSGSSASSWLIIRSTVKGLTRRPTSLRHPQWPEHLTAQYHRMFSGLLGGSGGICRLTATADTGDVFCERRTRS